MSKYLSLIHIYLIVEDGQTIKTGEVLVKIPRAVGGAGAVSYTHLDVYKRQLSVLLIRKLLLKVHISRVSLFLALCVRVSRLILNQLNNSKSFVK